MADEDYRAAATPPRIRGRRSWRSAVPQADDVVEQVLCSVSHSAYGSKHVQLVRRHLHQEISDMLDGRTFGRGDVDVLWASEITEDLTNFLQATDKSTFISQHEERWPGVGNLYCECFVRATSHLSIVGIDDKISFHANAQPTGCYPR